MEKALDITPSPLQKKGALSLNRPSTSSGQAKSIG